MESDVELLEDLCARRFPGEMKRIKDAVLLCRHAHMGQKRKTGEVYATHPVAVARLLLRFDHSLVDANSVIAALLHDVLEDTALEPTQLEKSFGPDVLRLVQALTKPDGKDKLRLDKDRLYRAQLEEAGSSDPRVLLIKLADVLDNMQTFHVHSDKRREEKEEELRIWYVPMARKLGLNDIADQMAAMVDT